MSIEKDILKLSSFIEENTRASETSGITYIDPRNFSDRILLKQNHVIFGRRGAGKSSLIKTLKENKSKNYYFSYTNLEDLKDVSFPNILIHVLNDFKIQLGKQLKYEIRWYQIGKKKKCKALLKLIHGAIDNFGKELHNPDKYDEDIKTKKASSLNINTSLKVDPLTVSSTQTENDEIEIAKKINRDKLESIKNAIPNLKRTLKEINSYSPTNPVFIIFDDFYFLKKEVQTFFIDFFHRLTKDTNLYIKVATIKHRSKIYSKFNGSHFGTEIGHDIHEIDLDYNLNRFEELKEFMKSLIEECSKLSKVSFNVYNVFSSGAFNQLCLASGGVPRDFLTLFVKVSNSFTSESKKITKTNITEAAIQNMANKNSSLGMDSDDEKEILEIYLGYIKGKILVEKRTNMFLVSNQEIEKYSQIRQAIKELVDLRMIHLVEPDTSASGATGGSGGQRYTAYILDVGLYTSAVQVNFNQLDPGITDQAGRKDQMRGAPKINLQELSSFMESKDLKKKLEISDE